MPTRNSDHPFADVPAGPDLATLEQDKQALEGYLAALVVAEQEYADARAKNQPDLDKIQKINNKIAMLGQIAGLAARRQLRSSLGGSFGGGCVANLAIISCRSGASPTNPIGFVHTNPISRLLDLLLLALTWSEGVGYLKMVKLGGADGSPAGSIGFDRRLG